MSALPTEPLLAWTERALDLLEHLAGFKPARPGDTDGCVNELAQALQLLSPSVLDTDWVAVQANLEHWETTHALVLRSFRLTSSPAAELRSILQSE
jgi:hypothetical protein